MARFILEKCESFNRMEGPIIERVEECFNKEYESMAEVLREIRAKSGFGGFYILKNRLIEVEESTLDQDFLPLTIKEWPLYYNQGPSPYGDCEIAKIKVLD